MKRLLITGGSGLLGLNWACAMRRQFEVLLGTHQHVVALQGIQSIALDLESPGLLSEKLNELKPDLIVHAAGMTSVDDCEQQPARAEQANATTAENVAIATSRLGIKLVHISTDHLFSGQRPRVAETEEPQPLNTYARTKLQAERQVATANPDALIVRTNFFGWGHAGRRSFSDWIIDSLRAGRGITMFDDVFFTPILADRLAVTTHEVVEKGGHGIYNIVGDERISKFMFGDRLAEQFNLPKGLITRGQVDRSSLTAQRPHDMSLDNSKVRVLLNRSIGSLDDFLIQLRQQEQQGRAAELRHAVRER